MAIAMQTLLDTFAARVVAKLGIITIGSQKSELEGKVGDGKVNMRVIDPSHSVVSDTATVGSNSTSLSFGSVNQKKVEVPLRHYVTGFEASIIDENTKIAGTDLEKQIDKEATDVANAIRTAAVNEFVFKPNRVYAGGWAEVETASGELGDEAEGGVFGFINHKARAKLAVTQPFGSQVGEKLYRASEIGQGNDGSYFYNEKKMPVVTIASDDTFSVSATISSNAITALTITGSTGTQTLPKGTPVKLVGAKMCDALGNPTDEDAYIILKEAVSPASKVYTLTGKFDAPILTGAGRQMCAADGDDLASADITGASIIGAGTYYVGFLAVKDARGYGSVEVKGKDTEYKSTIVDGIKFSINAFSDKGKVDMVNGYRIDSYPAFGVVDPRLTALVYIKK